MENSRPLISILMAVYEPRMDWLKEQLDSLEAQTYPNLCLYVRDDCSPKVPFEEIKALVNSCIHSFPCEIRRNEENLGSNKTFELLTREADGTYFAYCDQDDVWLPEKLTVLQHAMETEKADLVCSDMVVIDNNGKKLADSITKVRRHHVFPKGQNLTEKLLIKNFASGCTVLIRSEIAKPAVPFCPYMVHDHYLSLYTAASGKIITIRQPLIFYRIHDENQTSILSGVTDRASYFHIRLEEQDRRLEWLESRLSSDQILYQKIHDARVWIAARKKWFIGDPSQGKTIWKYRYYDKGASLFELIMARMPEPVFRYAVKLIQKGFL